MNFDMDFDFDFVPVFAVAWCVFYLYKPKGSRRQRAVEGAQ